MNRPPVVTAPASLSGTTGQSVTWKVIVDDPDGDAITDIQFFGAVDGSIGGAPIGAHAESEFDWQACKPGTYEAFAWASSGNPSKYDTARTEITVTGEPADHYIDFLGGTGHFEPDTLFIQSGETVAWRAMDGQSHVIYSTSGHWYSTWIKSGCISANVTFTSSTPARIERFYCNAHAASTQVGVIIVNP